MLELKNIVKVYRAGDTDVRALRNVSLSFRQNEFVAILGQSGCGKTTLLNIVGGLDQYTSGDLIINGTSTKKYKDRDWDTYRNHSIGFIFQSYNLIPHQSVLANVELALTLSGVSKAERKKRATEVLTRVGLADQMKKKPNQMSGGQMQRVAIARALINDPDILLADEPTGALDSETSVQVMEILKEIAKDRLIIMVTHNPDLAKNYANRIITLLDGEVTSDSNPYSEETGKLPVSDNTEKTSGKSTVKENNSAVTVRTAKQVENKRAEGNRKQKAFSKESKTGRKKRTSMSFFTAVSLSLNNLMTKKTRTFLTAFAGSIGIIGIALILSLSTGFQSYIDKVEQDTLSAYPISIEKETMDYGSIMMSMMGTGQDEKTYEEGYVYSNDVMVGMMSTVMTGLETNDLSAFKKYVEDEANGFSEYSSTIQYGYQLDLLAYAKDKNNNILQVNPSILASKLGGGQMGAEASFGGFSTGYDVWSELLDGEEVLDSTYDIVTGRMPKAYNEAVVIVDAKCRLADTTMYTLGFKDQSEIDSILMKLYSGEQIEVEEERFTYEDLLGSSFYVVMPGEQYAKNEDTGIWEPLSQDTEAFKMVTENGVKVSIVGIIMPSEESNARQTAGGIGYTSALTKYLASQAKDCAVVKAQQETEDVDILTGQPFAMGTSAEDNYRKFGVVDLDSPSRISIYASNFEAKEKLADLIEDYNQKMQADGQEDSVINYTDFVALMMSSVSTVVNTISYVLIAFVSISLVVSSIMIGIITYISVLERTKEIGVLRSIGASKRDVKRVFNAETLIVGFVAGMLGILITLLLDIPVNAIIKALSGVENVAKLPFAGAAILVFISVALTMIAGLIPAGLAAKKDPVVALRTE